MLKTRKFDYNDAFNFAYQEVGTWGIAGDQVCSIYAEGYSDDNNITQKSRIQSQIPKYSDIIDVSWGVSFTPTQLNQEAGDSYEWTLEPWVYKVRQEDGTTYTSSATFSTGESLQRAQWKKNEANIKKSAKCVFSESFSNNTSSSYMQYTLGDVFNSKTEKAGLIKETTVTTSKLYEIVLIGFEMRFTGWSLREIGGNFDAPWIEYKFTPPTIALNPKDSLGTIQLISSDNVIKSDNIYSMDVNSSFTVRAEPKDPKNYRFDRWSDGNTNKERTFSLADDVHAFENTYEAIFVPYHTINYELQQGEFVTSPTRYYDNINGKLKDDLTSYGQIISIIEMPEVKKTGFTFIGWSTPEDSTLRFDRIVSISDQGPKTFIANWERNYYNIHLTVKPQTAFQDPCNISLYRQGDSEALWGKGSIANLAYETEIAKIAIDVGIVEKWELDRINYYTIDQDGNEILKSQFASDQNLKNFKTIDSDVKYEVIFKLKKYRLTPMSSISNGAYFELNGVPCPEGGQQYDYGTQVTVSAFPKYGYRLTGWDNDSTIQPIKVFTIQGTLSPIARIEAIDLINKPTDLQISDSIIEKKIEIYSEENVKHFGKYAFYNCDKLKFAEVAPNNNATDGSKFNENFQIYDHAFEGCIDLVVFKVPETCTYLGASAFKNCENLIALIIPGENTKLSLTDVYEDDSPFAGTKIEGILSNPNSFGRIFVHPNTYSFYTGNGEGDNSNWSQFSNLIRQTTDYKDICGLED